ncbi:TGD2 [Scenedesmus sp. PABB004]|nr:TGD2 [Scenedesmus sp. PABB004]
MRLRHLRTRALRPQVNDVSSVIPRNSVVEANQSGLIAEPLVDITPQLRLPTYTASPLEVAACEAEGAIVCAAGHIRGQQGVALDDMVYVMTRTARQMEEEGVDKFFEAAQAAKAALEEAALLLEEAAQLTKEVTPLLQALQSAVLTDDNVRALRAAVMTLCKTLEHVESISADVSVFSRDTGVQRNLKTLITALSRIIEE